MNLSHGVSTLVERIATAAIYVQLIGSQETGSYTAAVVACMRDMANASGALKQLAEQFPRRRRLNCLRLAPHMHTCKYLWCTYCMAARGTDGYARQRWLQPMSSSPRLTGTPATLRNTRATLAATSAVCAAQDGGSSDPALRTPHGGCR
eukprot:359365-Chlamydomonas_euryale.AAC.2